MDRYPEQAKVFMAVDCIIFGFDGKELKILLVQRALEPQLGSWSLMGGFVFNNETIQQAAARVLQARTGLSNVYLEELSTFSEPTRDPVERTVSVAFFALIDINKYKKQITDDFHAEWFAINNHPQLIFDHKQMVEKAKARLRYKAAFHPILFELLPSKFTLPQLKNLYEEVYNIEMDNRNFSRKILSMNLLEKLDKKDKENSKKGAWYYKMNRKNYKANFHAVATIIPNPDIYYS
jgi:ADP-ribose pyrophosphatase YjhB (NUDIX family)